MFTVGMLVHLGGVDAQAIYILFYSCKLLFINTLQTILNNINIIIEYGTALAIYRSRANAKAEALQIFETCTE